MSLTKRSVETLIDLVEIKLSCIEVFDREDSRELVALEAARRELQALVPIRRKREAAPVAAEEPQPTGP